MSTLSPLWHLWWLSGDSKPSFGEIRSLRQTCRSTFSSPIGTNWVSSDLSVCQPPAFSNRSAAKLMFNSAIHSENSAWTCYRAALTGLKKASVFAEHHSCHLIHGGGNVTGYRATATPTTVLSCLVSFTLQEMPTLTSLTQVDVFLEWTEATYI